MEHLISASVVGVPAPALYLAAESVTEPLAPVRGMSWVWIENLTPVTHPCTL